MVLQLRWQNPCRIEPIIRCREEVLFAFCYLHRISQFLIRVKNVLVARVRHLNATDDYGTESTMLPRIPPMTLMGHGIPFKLHSNQDSDRVRLDTGPYFNMSYTMIDLVAFLAAISVFSNTPVFKWEKVGKLFSYLN